MLLPSERMGSCNLDSAVLLAAVCTMFLQNEEWKRTSMVFFESKIDDLIPIPVALSPFEKREVFIAAFNEPNKIKIRDLCVASIKALIRSKIHNFPNSVALRTAIDRFATPLLNERDPSKLMLAFANTMLHHAPHSEAAIIAEFVTDSGAIDYQKIEEVMLRIVLRLNVEAPDFGQSCLLFCRLCSFLVNGYAQIDILAIGTMGITREMGAVLGPQADLSPVGLMRIAMRALLLEVRQEHLTGSCAMVSVLSAIQNDHPKVFLAMLREMFRYG
ncbi:MAG: hypothetical protein LBF24_01095, partial [Puniceicoccales bacterium]|nr:hypothetical protein [Puniceicoccales bacterium]